ncbi:unnamed protein product [Cylindrotheca closterium]|uniref:Uncharacterized protein n=1 Tax=Cylindrotheca closterium TaxID=2856 RepID=A0AAD2FTB4_9STRA|nr:unnamed protein product [Cylindrotheca closterium]
MDTSLWVFKCCSGKHYDWLAGKPVPLPEEPNYRQREIDLENSTSDETNWEVSVFKKIQGSRTELRLGQNRKGGLIAVRVNEQGLLYGDLRVGQRIISIHGNPPEENDEESNEEDHDGTNVSQAKFLVQKKMKGGTRNLVQTVKTKTKDIGGVKNKKTLAGADNVAEGMRTLIDHASAKDYLRVSIVSCFLFVLIISGVDLWSTGVTGLESPIDNRVQIVDLVKGELKKGVHLLDDALRVHQAISYLQDDSSHDQEIQYARSALDDIATQTADVDTNLDPVNQALAGVLALAIIVILVSIVLYMLAHETLCYQGMDALSANTNALFVILCMSLLIMTFRVALWDAVSSPLQQASEDKEKEDPDKIMRTGSKKRMGDFLASKIRSP